MTKGAGNALPKRDWMSTESEKYRMAAKAALGLAEKAKDEESKASWLRHFDEWTQLAEEAEEAERSGK